MIKATDAVAVQMFGRARREDGTVSLNVVLAAETFIEATEEAVLRWLHSFPAEDYLLIEMHHERQTLEIAPIA